MFAQLVDDATGRVVGNISTAVPVTPDVRGAHWVTIPMQSIYKHRRRWGFLDAADRGLLDPVLQQLDRLDQHLRHPA